MEQHVNMTQRQEDMKMIDGVKVGQIIVNDAMNNKIIHRPPEIQAME